MSPPSVPLRHLFLFGYWLLVFVGRVVNHGYSNFYEMLWGCNVALFIVPLGIFLSEPRLAGAGATLVTVDQLLWWLDCGGFVVTRALKGEGKFVVGVAKYLTWPADQCSNFKKMTAFHHLWFLPVCLWALSDHGGVPAGSWLLSAMMSTVLSVYCRCFTPFYSFPQPLFDKADKAHSEPIYMNINLGHTFWKDIRWHRLHAFDGSGAVVYLAFLCLVCNVGLNLPWYICLRWLSPCGGVFP